MRPPDDPAARSGALEPQPSPRVPLGRWPTPVSAWPELAAALGLGSLHVKREDLAAAGCGGNKIRGLELLLGGARARGARRVVAYGPEGSNWCHAAAHHARAAGIPCDLVLAAWPDPRVPPDVRAEARARSLLAERLADSCRRTSLAGFPLALLHAARQPGALLLPPGGSSPLAAVGHAEACAELGAQVSAGELPQPTSIYVALGSGATAAGLAAGACLGDSPIRIVAVRVAPRLLANRPLTAWLARRTLALLGAPERSAELARRLHVDHRFAGRGYRIPTQEARAARELASGLPGGRLELSYTAKAMAALLADAGSGRLEGAHVVFWQSFGAAVSSPQPVA